MLGGVGGVQQRAAAPAVLDVDVRPRRHQPLAHVLAACRAGRVEHLTEGEDKIKNANTKKTNNR